MKRDCIGVIIGQAERAYQQTVLEGISKVATDKNLNVAIFTTTCHGGSENYRKGEAETFFLPDYEQFYGLIYLPDTIEFRDRLSEIEKRLRKAQKKGVPVISIDQTGNFPTLWGNDAPAMEEIVEHLVDKHGCKRIAFMTGVEGHPHSSKRLEAFKAALAKRDITLTPDLIFYGDFWYFKGEEVVTGLIANGEMPDAIACASDRMAHSVYRALTAHGFKVPEDVIVTGYCDGSEHMEYITSVQKDSNRLGERAAELICEWKNAKKLPDQDFFEVVDCTYTLQLSVSCGCLSRRDFDFSSSMTIAGDDNSGYYSESNTMDETLVTARSLREFFTVLDRYTYYIGNFNDLYFCMSEGWDDPTRPVAKETYGKAGAISSKKMSSEYTVYYSKERIEGTSDYNVTISKDRKVSKELLIPYLFTDEKKPQTYFFRMLHYSDMSFGYVAIGCPVSEMAENDIINCWLRDSGISLEAQCRFNSTKFFYEHDTMTRLYNRNGFYERAEQYISEAQYEGYQVAVIMGDINGLKYINDTYGHNEGDACIVTAANALTNCSLEGTVRKKAFRMGGDEFLELAVGKYGVNSVEEFENNFELLLKYYNQASGKPYLVNMSVGVNIIEPTEEVTISDIISVSDEEMYSKKNRLKAEGFKPEKRSFME